ncbi:hypothetical protein L226DRAFT_562211 [Lentinus tigrinus ALCF2SS1-7]|uniref:uncharacterized protein n=1 Tax=Lentinus tigrinus ALCF2SS1-7 TaxID=1328758 RepID=UPI001165CD8F|nr:hypothetical protein L226DRAFT_562211 [Lentinus tigrinus ALCF2SS1-7]
MASKVRSWALSLSHIFFSCASCIDRSIKTVGLNGVRQQASTEQVPSSTSFNIQLSGGVRSRTDRGKPRVSSGPRTPDSGFGVAGRLATSYAGVRVSRERLHAARCTIPQTTHPLRREGWVPGIPSGRPNSLKYSARAQRTSSKRKIEAAVGFQIPKSKFQSRSSKVEVPKSKFQSRSSKVEVPKSNFESVFGGGLPIPSPSPNPNVRARFGRELWGTGPPRAPGGAKLLRESLEAKGRRASRSEGAIALGLAQVTEL